MDLLQKNVILIKKVLFFFSSKQAFPQFANSLLMASYTDEVNSPGRSGHTAERSSHGGPVFYGVASACKSIPCAKVNTLRDTLIFIHVASKNLFVMPSFINVTCKFMCEMRHLIFTMFSFICNVSIMIYPHKKRMSHFKRRATFSTQRLAAIHFTYLYHLLSDNMKLINHFLRRPI